MKTTFFFERPGTFGVWRPEAGLCTAAGARYHNSSISAHTDQLSSLDQNNVVKWEKCGIKQHKFHKCP